MPNYDYACKLCGHQFEEFHHMSDRLEPEALPCPDCGLCGSVFQVMGATKLVDPFVVGTADARPHSAFNHVMDGIRKNYPGNKLN